MREAPPRIVVWFLPMRRRRIVRNLVKKFDTVSSDWRFNQHRVGGFADLSRLREGFCL